MKLTSDRGLFLAYLLYAAIMLVGFPAFLDRPPPLPDATPTPRAIDPEAVALLNALNAARGPSRPPLAWSGTLAKAALWIAEDNAGTGTLSHVGTDGSWHPDRAHRAGYPSFATGEVAAETSPRGEVLGVAGLWLDSPSHRALVLDPTFRACGIAWADGHGRRFVFAVLGEVP